MAGEAVITVSAPGSLMLMGEHAVLHGYRALVCAINRRITVHLTPLAEKRVFISSALGDYESPLQHLTDHSSFRFVLQVLRQHAARLPSGVHLRIESEFPADIGFGSSAAVTVAAHGAVLAWLGGELPDKGRLLEHALHTVHAVQGRGSGADLAASVLGGVVCYTTAPTMVPVPISLPITAVYCGYKTPTAEVIRRVEQGHQECPDRIGRIYAGMDSIVADAVQCLHRHDMPGFGALVDGSQQLMDDLGVNTPELEEIVLALRGAPGINGAKISGSGLGDCAIGIGHADLKLTAYPVYHLETSSKGCECHE